MIGLGLLIIAIGAFCQSSSYVPINKIKDWSWESYWIVQGVFAWLILPFVGLFLAIPQGHTVCELFDAVPAFNIWLTVLCGVLWGVGGLTFGLSMRYLGVALGQSISLGTCAAAGTVIGPVLLNVAFPEMDALSALTSSVFLGVVATLVGIGVIGLAGWMKSRTVGEGTVKEFNFPKGICIALLAGFMSGCFNLGLTFGADINFGDLTPAMFSTLPATFLITLGGFLTNACYCFYQNTRNHTWADYGKGSVWVNNLLFCLLAGALWYSQFFSLSLAKGFLGASTTLMTLSFCILMALNVVFSNIWGLIFKEWQGCTKATVTTLAAGILILIVSCFLPQLI